MTRGDHRRRRPHSGHVVQSNCGDVKMRGTVDQVIGKYNQLAAEDPHNRELYLQHAEHYTRVKSQFNNGENYA